MGCKYAGAYALMHRLLKIFAMSVQVLQGVEAAHIFGGSSNGDSNPLRQLIAGQGADDDPLLLQGFKEGLTVADADKNKIGGRRQMLHTHVLKCLPKKFQAGGIIAASFAHVLDVVQRSQCPSLSDGVDVERLAHFFESSDQVGMADAVTDAQAGEAEDFGEGAHQEEVRLLAAADQGEQVEGIIEELEVRFVEDEEYMGRHVIDEPLEFSIAHDGAGGVVGIGDEDDARLRGDGAK